MVVNWIEFEQNVEMSFTRKMNDLRQVNAKHGGFVEIVLGENAELRFADQFLGFVDVCALEKFQI